CAPSAVIGSKPSRAQEWLMRSRVASREVNWPRDGFEPMTAEGAQAVEALPPALSELIRRGEAVHFSSVLELQPAAREQVAKSGLKSNLTLPLAVGDDVVGALAFGLFRREQSWDDHLVGRLKLVANLFGSVLSRQRYDAEVRELTAQLRSENQYLRDEIASTHGFREIVGQSPPLEGALYKVEQVAPTDAPVLILGETGTGKELFARAVHDHSPRRQRSLVKVNCAALPATLIESELFGHVKGAFTGATAAKAGRFELADGGTLFLDEIGEMELDLQAKLLRVLQEGEFEPVGSGHTRKVDVRVIAATNRDFEQAMAEGRFRSDLYYRLSVFPIVLPSLRERPGDVQLLVQHFVERGNQRLGRRVSRVPQRAIEALEAHDWPGNVRELQNVVDRALILSPGETLELDASFLGGEIRSEPVVSEPAEPAAEEVALHSLAEAERRHIRGVLEARGWRINGPDNAAEILGLHPSTLRHRLKKLGITRPD
ncbi:MAG: sigma 54-interacting transcriptional regulator, partial [Acidobacteriota bacterium]